MTSSKITMTAKFGRRAVAAVLAASLLVGGPAMATDDHDSWRKADISNPVRFSGTIVDAAVQNPKLFNTLVTVLSAADLVKTLQGPGPFTVFAPTDEAFKKIPEPVLSWLVSDPKALTDVLLYHVAGGRKDLRFSFKTRDIKTVQGQEIYAERERDTLFINNSKVIGQPIVTDNGVIYVVDSVLLPQFR
jgi:uncharacterized surface protein with fasciclin (FAS1) repeats